MVFDTSPVTKTFKLLLPLSAVIVLEEAVRVSISVSVLCPPINASVPLV